MQERKEQEGVIQLPAGNFRLEIIGARDKEGITYLVYDTVLGADQKPIEVGHLPKGVRKLRCLD